MEKELIQSLDSLSFDMKSAERIVLIILMISGGRDGNCYLSVETIASRAGLSTRRATDQLNALRERGLISRRDAAQEPNSPKTQGWIYTVNIDAINALSGVTQRHPDAASPLTQRHPDDASTASRAPKKNLEEIKPSDGGRSVTLTQRPPSTTVHYSDTSKGGDRGTSSPPSRACADAREGQTYSDPTSTKNSESYQAHEADTPPRKVVDRADVAAIKQALEEALPTVELSGVRGLYGMAQTILEGRGELEAARRYVEARGLEWTQRLLEGQRYSPHAIARLIARDAATWRAPSAPKQAAMMPAVTHAAPPQDTPPAALPHWWDTLLKQLYEALRGHRRHDTPPSRIYAKELGSLLYHLARAQRVELAAGQLTITIDDSGPDPDTFALATSYIPILLKRANDITLDSVRLIRAHQAISRAS